MWAKDPFHSHAQQAIPFLQQNLQREVSAQEFFLRGGVSGGACEVGEDLTFLNMSPIEPNSFVFNSGVGNAGLSAAMAFNCNGSPLLDLDAGDFIAPRAPP